MKRKIFSAVILAAGIIGTGSSAASAASAAELPVVGSLAGDSDRTLLPGMGVPFPEQLVGPSRQLSTTLTPVLAPL